MRLDRLHFLTALQGPFATVSTDVTRDDEAGAHELAARWDSHARRLAELGAPEDLLAAMGTAVTRPTQRSGKVGRLVVATAAGVALDYLLPEPPVREQATWGPVPDLLPVVRALSAMTSYLLAEIDSAGADLHVVSADGSSLEAATIEGEHDVLHKVPGGGWAHRRLQMRVEDSIARNAGEVAEALAREVRRHSPDVVLLTGQDKPVAAVLDQLPTPVTERSRRIHSGGRAAGTDDEALDQAVNEVLADHDRERRDALLERFSAAEGRQAGAVQGLDNVVTVLQQGQVDELLLREESGADDMTAQRCLWTTGRPEQLAVRRADLEAMGAEDTEQVSVGAALVWAAVGTGASMTLLDGQDRSFTDSVAALLRWTDASTPHDAVPSMPGHGELPGG